MLRTELRKWIPARIEQNEDGSDVVLRSNRKKYVDALLEPCLILLPKQVVEKDSHSIHAESLGPTKFLVDLLGIEYIGLPHFQLVDRT